MNTLSNKKENEHLDPVCGMVASSEIPESKYQGKDYYFCSEHCKEQFDANPEEFNGQIKIKI